MGLDGAITRGKLLLIGIEEFEILLEHEDVFGAVVPAQGGDDLGLGRVTPDVAMLGEVLRIALAGDDVAEDAQAGDTGDVADDQRQLHVHLDQRFLHALHEGTRALDQRGPVPKIPPQRDDAVGGAEAAAQESQDVEVAEPFTVGDIALPAGKIFDMAGIDEDHLKPRASRISKMGIQ